MSSLVRRIQKSAERSKRIVPVTPYNGRGSKLGFQKQEGEAKPKKAPRGSRRGGSKMRGPFGKRGDA